MSEPKSPAPEPESQPDVAEPESTLEPRRRWTPRFGLRLLLVGGPLIAILLALVVFPQRQAYLERLAIEAIERAGGTVERNEQQRVIRVYLGKEIDDEKFQLLVPHLARLGQLEELDLSFSLLTDESVEAIASLTRIKAVYFMGTPGVTKQGKEQLAQLRPELSIQEVSPNVPATVLAMRDIYDHAVASVAFVGEDMLLAGTGAGELHQWTREDRYGAVGKRHDDWTFSIAAGLGGAWATGGGDDLIRVTRGDGAEVVLGGHLDDVHKVRFLPGNRLASVSDDRTLRIWDLDRRRELFAVEAHAATVPALAASPDGAVVATGGRDDVIRLWDAGNGRLLREITGHDDDVMSLAFDPSGRRLASASYDQTVRLWDVETGEPLRVLGGYSDWVFAVTFSPDGRYLAAGAAEGLRLYDGTDFELKFSSARQKDVSSLAFSPRGDLLAAGSAVGNVALWDLAARDISRTYWTRAAERGLPIAPDGARELR